MRRRLILVLGSLIILAGIVLAGIGLQGIAFTPELSETPHSNNTAATVTPIPAEPIQEKPSAIPLPESGRLTIAYSELPRHKAISFALPMIDGAIGDAPLPARVVDIEGRVIDTVVNPVADDPTSATLSLDPDWLTPGRYMIQLRTLEQSALPLRRFVLIIE